MLGRAWLYLISTPSQSIIRNGTDTHCHLYSLSYYLNYETNSFLSSFLSLVILFWVFDINIFSKSPTIFIIQYPGFLLIQFKLKSMKSLDQCYMYSRKSPTNINIFKTCLLLSFVYPQNHFVKPSTHRKINGFFFPINWVGCSIIMNCEQLRKNDKVTHYLHSSFFLCFSKSK